jgi:hypothetical protein
MRPSVARMMQGIVETLRDDVIPHVGDGYARGQALGVIDLLNNYGARLDWDGGQIAAQIAAKRAALAEAAALMGGAGETVEPVEVPPSAALLAEAAELDRQISERLLGWMAEGGAGEAAVARLRRHMHDELREEMKLTHRPSFAEIAKGGASGKESGT